MSSLKWGRLRYSMPKLENKKHEAFCKSVAEGESRTEAYRLHVAEGEETKSITLWPAASRLYSDCKVSARIQELREKLDDDGPWAASLKEVKGYLTRVLRTPIGQIDEDSDLAQEVTYEVQGGGARGKLKQGIYPEGNEQRCETVEVAKIKSVSKMDAIEKLAKMNRWYAQDLDSGQTADAATTIASAINGWKAPRRVAEDESQT